jgi:lipoprotein-anchoring transpeptidase ErfK/SrfK
MRAFLAALLILTSLSSRAFAQDAFEVETQPSLLDVASPEEVAEELGLSPELLPSSNPISVTESKPGFLSPMSMSSFNESARLDLTQYFPVVVLVNKADSGPSAQTMKVYHRGVLTYQFAVSTGREKWEDKTKSGRQYFSTTSTGWFAPLRTYDKYYSKTWEAWMNNSIFFNGGLALHATTPEHFKELGHRASGGCVRLHPTNAKLLYDLVLSEGKGNVPAYTSQGQILRRMFGQIQYRQNWNTLIIIEDNPNN